MAQSHFLAALPFPSVNHLSSVSSSRNAGYQSCTGIFIDVCSPAARKHLKGYMRPRCGFNSIQSNLVGETKGRINIEEWNKQVQEGRLVHLHSQAIDALKKAVELFQNPTFPCALIAGDVVILDLLSQIGALSNNKVAVVCIDTFHLFPETYSFLQQLEERYSFKAHIFKPAGFLTKEEYVAVHGSDLFLRDIDEYDRLCKVEPFNRALSTLKTDVMINGRRRDHAAERAHLEMFEDGKMVKVQPLAYWEFRDCWNYLLRHGIPYHPLHDQGYPSIGDVQSTLPVPKGKWFEYGGERSGRFQGLTNKDGSSKTECGIHVGKQ